MRPAQRVGAAARRTAASRGSSPVASRGLAPNSKDAAASSAGGCTAAGSADAKSSKSAILLQGSGSEMGTKPVQLRCPVWRACGARANAGRSLRTGGAAKDSAELAHSQLLGCALFAALLIGCASRYLLRWQCRAASAVRRPRQRALAGCARPRHGRARRAPRRGVDLRVRHFVARPRWPGAPAA